MKINIWKCNELNLWRWTICDNSRPIVKQESGQNNNLNDTMSEIKNIIESMTSHK